MYRVSTTIEGLAPILFNAPSLDMLDAKPGQRQQTDAQRDQDAMKRLYKNGAGVYLPAWNVKKCILNGFQTLDLRVAGSKTKRLWRFVQPVLFLEPSELPFVGKADADFLHKCPGRNADGSATIVRRPALNAGWRLTFRMNVLDDLVREADLRLALQAAGERVGLGGWRPEYGRFIIEEWSVQPTAPRDNRSDLPA